MLEYTRDLLLGEPHWENILVLVSTDISKGKEGSSSSSLCSCRPHRMRPGLMTCLGMFTATVFNLGNLVSHRPLFIFLTFDL